MKRIVILNMASILKYRLIIVCILAFLLLLPLSAIDISLEITHPKCYGQAAGSIHIDIRQGVPRYLFILCKDSLRKEELKRSPLLDYPSYTFREVAAGIYFVFTVSGDGKVCMKKVSVIQPSQLNPGRIVIEKYPSSPSSHDAMLKANPSGGTPPYLISWQGTAVKGNQESLSNVGTGIYKCIITDSNGCGPVIATVFLGMKGSSKHSYLNIHGRQKKPGSEADYMSNPSG